MPGDIVVLGNLPVHKGTAAYEAVEAVGAQLLFLPTYTYDHQTINALHDAVSGAIDDICHSQADVCFAAAGYEPVGKIPSWQIGACATYVSAWGHAFVDRAKKTERRSISA